jgi:hypothetical protein
VKVRAIFKPNKTSETRSIGSTTRLKGIPETCDIESSVPVRNFHRLNAICFSWQSRTLLDNTGVEQTVDCRGAVETSDFVLDAIGSQQISRRTMRTDDA